MFRAALPVTLAVAAVLTGSALGDGTMTISLPDHAMITSRTEANVAITVACAAMPHQTSGSVDLTLAQTSGSKTATGAGSAPVTCDGRSHSYVVPVITASGRWHNGEATVSATGAADGEYTVTVCGTDENGNTVCDTVTATQHDEGTAGPAPITLANG